MNVRRAGFLSSLFLLPCVCLRVWAAGAIKSGVSPQFRNDGDSPIMFSVSCSSNATPAAAWTVLAASDTIRRSILVQFPVDNGVTGICISSNAASAQSCNDTLGGIELSTGTLGLSNLFLYTNSALYCRSRDNATVIGVLKGILFRDKRDQSLVGSAALQ